MIIDLPKFIAQERRWWAELEGVIERFEADPGHRLDPEGIKRFHYLYQRASADLAKIITFSAEPQTRRYLESLVARAYAEIHESRGTALDLSLGRRILKDFPAAVRAHGRVLALAAAVTLAGALFGGLAVSLDPGAREAIIPFEAVRVSPADRVAREEGAAPEHLRGRKASFSAYLVTHNTRVSIFTMALGMTLGVGTILLLFYNGAILGAVAADYLLAGEGEFLLGWLLPHGAVEIPAFVIAGQAGLLLAGAIIGKDDRAPLSQRLRTATPTLQALILGVAALLVWAGLVEAFLSQYHEPVVPYGAKIAFGLLEAVLLAAFLRGRGGGHP